MTILAIISCVCICSCRLQGGASDVGVAGVLTVNARCKVRVPKGYRLTVSTDGERTYWSDSTAPTSISILKKDNSEFFSRRKEMEENGAHFEGNDFAASYRNIRYNNPGQSVIIFRIDLQDAVVAITGEGASGYMDILGECIPKNFIERNPSMKSPLLLPSPHGKSI